jgi:hypothetical protein
MTSSSTDTPLDCFAAAMKHIIDAARIDHRCASIVPKFAVAFSNIAKDPKAKEHLDPNVAGSPVLNSTPSLNPVNLLLESMRILSLCAPSFGNQVSDLIPLIISVMPVASSPSGFASTEVNAETSAVSNTEKNSAMMLHSTAVEQDERKSPPSGFAFLF